jgi:hypothetical protein
MAVERTADFLAEIQKEHGYARSGNVDDGEISKLGRQFGVQLVCVADISTVLGATYASARLIDVETASVIATAEGYSDVEAIKDLVKTSESIAFQLMGISDGDDAGEATKVNGRKENKETGKKNNAAAASGITPGEEKVTDYKEAQVFCAQSSKGGFNDWRLPTYTELSSLYKASYEPTLNTTVGWYWSTTCIDKKCKDLQVFNMLSGRKGTAPQRKDIIVLCVR